MRERTDAIKVIKKFSPKLNITDSNVEDIAYEILTNLGVKGIDNLEDDLLFLAANKIQTTDTATLNSIVIKMLKARNMLAEPVEETVIEQLEANIQFLTVVKQILELPDTSTVKLDENTKQLIISKLFR